MTDQLSMTWKKIFTSIDTDLFYAEGLLGWSEKQFSP